MHFFIKHRNRMCEAIGAAQLWQLCGSSEAVNRKAFAGQLDGVITSPAANLATTVLTRMPLPPPSS